MSVGEQNQFIKAGLRRVGSDGTLVAFLLVLLLVVILLPLPPLVLDFLIAVNFVFAVVLLLTSLLHRKPNALSSFPTVLLVATLLRLSVNVSSTRLILLYGDQGVGVAGTIIQTFGELVVRGNFVVGAVIFGIIALVNFLVVAKGSARVAEVAARFVLDAVPGRQMTIDSEARAGRISIEEASRQRAELGRESQFFGAMDGAMKFVQGDAIAGFLIVVVNALGGLGLGVSRGLPWQESVSSFGVLAIGDGLVNCLPSLLTSLAAGFVVTHVRDEGTLSSGGQVFTQFLREPRILSLSAGAFLLFAVLPGFPTIPFLTMTVLLALSAWFARKNASFPNYAQIEVLPDGYPALSAPTSGAPGLGLSRPQVPGGAIALLGEKTSVHELPGSREMFALEVLVEAQSFEGRWDLADLQSPERSRFESLFLELSGSFARETGVKIPGYSFRPAPLFTDTELGEGTFQILFRDQVLRTSSLRFSEIFVEAGPAVVSLFGIRPLKVVRHPFDFSLCCWIARERSGIAALEALGVRIYEPAEYLALEVICCLRDHLSELIGIDEVKRDIAHLQLTSPGLVEEVIERGMISYPELSEIFRMLLRDHGSVRDTGYLLEGIAEFVALSPAPEKGRADWLFELAQHLRSRVRRVLAAQAIGPGARMRAFLLSSDVEEEFQSAIRSWEPGRSRLPLEPQFERRLRDSSRAMFQPVVDRGSVPVVLLCSGDIRLAVQDFFQRVFSSGGWFRALSFEDLHDGARPDVVGLLSC